MAKTVRETLDQAADVFMRGTDPTLFAFVSQFGNGRGKNADFGFFFAQSDEQAEDYRTRVEAREGTPYRIVDRLSAADARACGSCGRAFASYADVQYPGETLCRDCDNIAAILDGANAVGGAMDGRGIPL